MQCEKCGAEMSTGPSTPDFPYCNTWRCECGHVRPEIASGKLSPADEDFHLPLRSLRRRLNGPVTNSEHAEDEAYFREKLFSALGKTRKEMEDATLAITPYQIKHLAKKHIKRYSRMIASGHPSVRVDECERLLAIWKSVEEKKSWYKLNENERREVFEAYEDELVG